MPFVTKPWGVGVLPDAHTIVQTRVWALLYLYFPSNRSKYRIIIKSITKWHCYTFKVLHSLELYQIFVGLLFTYGSCTANLLILLIFQIVTIHASQSIFLAFTMYLCTISSTNKLNCHPCISLSDVPPSI